MALAGPTRITLQAAAAENCGDPEGDQIVAQSPPAFKLRSRKYRKFIADSADVLKDFPRLNIDRSATRTDRQTKRSKVLLFMGSFATLWFGHLPLRLCSDSATTLNFMEIKICTWI
jgi:hypothetical protein